MGVRQYGYMSRVCAWLLLAVLSGRGAEIHSNGRGGGPWSDRATWHGKRVPTAADSVVVAMRDIVAVDMDDSDTVSCKDVFLDPEGVLTFTPGMAAVLTIDGSIDSYGVIRIDGTAAGGRAELRVLGDAGAQPELRLRENSGLLIYGDKQRADGDETAVLSCVSRDPAQPHTPLMVQASTHTMLDIHHSRLVDVVVNASGVDNTGVRPKERLNIIANAFVGQSRLNLYACDTPVVRNNRFRAPLPSLAAAAIQTNLAKLAEIRGNRINGGYSTGVSVLNDTDSAIAENVISGCAKGIYAHGNNTMIQDNLVAHCPIGVQLHTARDVIENVIVEGAGTAFSFIKASVQVTSCRIENLQDGGMPMVLEESSVTLLNCNLEAEDLTLGTEPPVDAPWAQSMQYLVAKIGGQLPAGLEITVGTATVSGGVPANKADLNVRNSPTYIDPEGMTPLPRSMQCLIVRSWHLSAAGTKVNAPFYDLTVWAAPAAEGQARKPLKTELIEPTADWFRPDPDKPIPTLEVKLP